MIVAGFTDIFCGLNCYCIIVLYFVFSFYAQSSNSIIVGLFLTINTDELGE